MSYPSQHLSGTNRHTIRKLFFQKAPPWWGIIIFLGVSVSCCWGAESADYLNMSLSELLSVEITSVGKKKQPVSQAAAAVFVITQDDIRRSGVKSLPEVLRMVPGVQVARIDGNKWAISARGFNGRFANKLLVLMDGRSLYTPTFGGVYWDAQDTLLEDIDRIEVIRGPGASLWGSNAVNGVINIITKSAAQTQGALAVAGGGTLERGFGALRYGGALGEVGHYRVYAKYFTRDDNILEGSGRNANDHWDQVRTGFRADLAPSQNDAITTQGDFYQGYAHETIDRFIPVAPYQTLVDNRQDLLGFNLQTRWQHALSETDNFVVQAYYDQSERRYGYVGDRRYTGDVEFQYRTQRFDRHDLMLGFGYRYSQDDIRGSFMADLDPRRQGLQLFSAFAQDDIQLIPDTLVLTLGGRLEHNDFTGFEGQPNLRLLWTPDARNTVWASVARAVRIPTRVDQGSKTLNKFFPANLLAGQPFNTFLQAIGNRAFDAESVLAYETGYKHQISDALSVDLAAFYNRYTRLRSAHPVLPSCQDGVGLPPFCGHPDYLVLPYLLGNQARMDTYGVELAAEWRWRDNLKVQGAYTFFQAIQGRLPPGATAADDPKANPSQQMSLRLAWNPHPDWDVDAWLRYTDRIGGNFGATQNVRIPAYTQLDMRLAWRPLARLEFSVAGFNLLDDHHPEFRSEVNDVLPVEIKRSVYGQVLWSF